MKQRNIRTLAILFMVLGIVLGVGCGSPTTEEVSPTPVAAAGTAEATETVAATDTASPTVTVEPTATIEPTATAVTVDPTATTNSAAATPLIDQREAANTAVAWLITTHQNEDGGYTDFSTGADQAPSGIAGTLDAIQAIAASGHNPGANYPGQSSNPVAYLQNSADAVAAYAAGGGGQAGKVILGLTAANQNPRDFGGYNIVISLTTQISPTGQLNATTPFNQSLALLALAAVHEETPETAVAWLKDQQADNGSWDDGFGTSDNPDATGMAIMALLAQGEAPDSPALSNARAFLAGAQLPTGGWEYGPGFGQSANSTALALQALSALGEDFYSPGGPWAQEAGTPLTALHNYQSDTGAFQSDFGDGPFDDFFATIQSLPGITGRAYPLPAHYEAAKQALSCLATLQDPATGGWEQFATFGVNAGGTARAIEAIAATGADPQSDVWTQNGTNAVAALEALTPAYLESGRGGRVGIVMQGVVAAGEPYTVTEFAGFNLPLTVSGYLSPTGEYAATNFGPVAHSEAMLGLIPAGEVPDATAVTWLQEAASDGSWGSADANGLALNVLGRLDTAVGADTINQLRSSQLADGSWGFEGVSNVSATAEVVLGLVQQGENPFAPGWSVVANGALQNAGDVVLAQQAGNGCWPNLFGEGDDPFATTDAILLLTADPNWPSP